MSGGWVLAYISRALVQLATHILSVSRAAHLLSRILLCMCSWATCYACALMLFALHALLRYLLCVCSRATCSACPFAHLAVHVLCRATCSACPLVQLALHVLCWLRILLEEPLAMLLGETTKTNRFTQVLVVIFQAPLCKNQPGQLHVRRT